MTEQSTIPAPEPVLEDTGARAVETTSSRGRRLRHTYKRTIGRLAGRLSKTETTAGPDLVEASTDSEEKPAGIEVEPATVETETGEEGTGEPEDRFEGIPDEIASSATDAGLKPEILRMTREVLETADWTDVMDYLLAAQRSPTLREHLKRFHGIELDDPAEEHSIATLPLKKVIEVAPKEYEAERQRRQEEKKAELAEMLTKATEAGYIPAELPLNLDYIEVPPELFVTSDPEGAYGIWRRLKIQEYSKRIAQEPVYVRWELKRFGLPIPVLRGLTATAHKWQLALKILMTEKREARKAGLDPNYGTFGYGTKRLKQISRTLENYDHEVRDSMRALGLKNRSYFAKDGQDTPRRHLAETLIKIKEEELAHQKGHLDPIIPRRKKALGSIESQPEEMVA